jgi:hypothetical protein
MSKLKRAISWLCYLFIAALPFQTHWLYKQLLMNDQPWQYGALRLYASESLLLLIFSCAIIYLAIDFIQQKRWANVKPPTQRIIGLILLSVAIFINIYFSINREICFYRWEIIIGAAALSLILILFCEKQKIAAALVASGTLQSLIALQQFFAQKISANKWLGIAAQNPSALGAPVIETADGRWLRAFGAFSHPNILGGFLVFSLLAGLYLLLSAKTTNQRRVLFITAGLTFVGLITTFSRSAWLAFAVGFLTLIIARRVPVIPLPSRTPVILSGAKNPLLQANVLFVIIATIFVIAFPTLFLTRADLTNRLETKSVSERFYGYEQATQIAQKFYLFGTGAGNYTVALNQIIPNQPAWFYQPIHNIFFLIFIELGVVGILLLIISIVLICHPELVSGSIQMLKQVQHDRQAPTAPITATSMGTAFLSLGLLDHYLWSMYVGIMLIAVVTSMSLACHCESRHKRDVAIYKTIKPDCFG